MRRLTAVLTLALTLGLFITGCDLFGLTDDGDSESPSQNQRQFRVEQGDECFCVTALSWKAQTIEDFYGYGDKNSNTPTDIEKSDVSNLFLFKGPKGTSLVALHDKRTGTDYGTEDTGGGAVSFEMVNLPSDAGLAVRDDDPSNDNWTSAPDRVDWTWATRNTDGGAWRGGFDSDFDVTIEPAFNDAAALEPESPGTIDKWEVLSGDASSPARTGLDLDKPVTISTKCDCQSSE